MFIMHLEKSFKYVTNVSVADNCSSVHETQIYEKNRCQKKAELTLIQQKRKLLLKCEKLKMGKNRVIYILKIYPNLK